MIKLKVIVAGAKDVGKTSLIKRYVHGTFETDTFATIGVDFMTRKVNYKEKQSVQLTLWDFAGETKYRASFPKYISGASAALLLFDITNQDSFNDLDNWLEMIENTPGKIIKFLIGSKHDLEDSRTISHQEIESFIQIHTIDKFMYCSAKTGENVNEIFDTLTKIIVETRLRECPHCKELISKDLVFCLYCGTKIE